MELVYVEIGVLGQVQFEIEAVLYVGLEGVEEARDCARVSEVLYEMAKAGEGFGFGGAGWGDLLF